MPRYNPEKREQLAEQMRADILRCYIRLAAEIGDVSMERLASEVGIAKGTLYLYYKTKADLLRAALALGRSRMLERMTETLNKSISAPEKIEEYARWMMEEFRDHRLLRMEYLRNNNEQPLPKNVAAFEILSKIIEQGIQEQTIRPMNVEDIVFLIRSSLIGQFAYLLREGRELDMDRSIFMFKDVILRGILR